MSSSRGSSDSGVEPASSVLQADSLLMSHQGNPNEEDRDLTHPCFPRFNVCNIAGDLCLSGTYQAPSSRLERQ